MMKLHQDVIISVIILIFCAFFGYLSLQMDMGPAMMPLILLAFMAILGILILIDGIKKTRLATEDSPVKPFITCATIKIPMAMFSIIVAYILLFYFIGYYLATTIFLIVGMRFLKQKKWLPIILITAGFLLFAYFFLVRQLNVSIDEFGWIGNWLQMRAMVQGG